MDGIGGCWDRFGRKTLLTFTGYKDRAPGVLKELDRIGMKEVNVQWQFPNPFESVLLKHLSHESGMSSGYMNATMGHYAAIKTAYHLGAESCIIIEDDIRFLKDIDAVSKTVDALPKDFDVALFDMFVHGGIDQEYADYVSCKNSRKVNPMWAEYDNLLSQGCYAMSRRAMKRYIWLNEAAVTEPKIGKLRIGDHFLSRRYMGNDMNMYFSVEHVAIQKIMGNNNNNVTNIYGRMAVDESLYGE